MAAQAGKFGGSIARRYARALFEIGVDAKDFEGLGAQLETLASLYDESAELRHTLENPVFAQSQKRAVLDKILSRMTTADTLRRFALLLLERRRISFLPGIARAFAGMTDVRLNRVRAVVTSAKPLDIITMSEIQKALERRTRKNVVITTQIDPGLIGGVVARVGDLVLDGSIRSQLAALKNRVLN